MYKPCYSKYVPKIKANTEITLSSLFNLELLLTPWKVTFSYFRASAHHQSFLEQMHTLPLELLHTMSLELMLTPV